MSDKKSNIKVIYEDDDLIAINKPAGLLVHDAEDKNDEYTLVDWIKENYPEIVNVGEPVITKDGKSLDRPGVVHRLDKDTTGVLLIAKNQKMHAYLKKQFQNREIVKIYTAFVYGEIKEKRGVIDKPIGRSASRYTTFSAERGKRGEIRDALTWYYLVKSSPEVSFLEVEPKTGRTHQIRVHMKAIQHPIIKDPLYASKLPSLLGFKRLALHAYKITFRHINGESITIKAPFTKDFKDALKDMDIDYD